MLAFCEYDLALLTLQQSHPRPEKVLQALDLALGNLRVFQVSLIYLRPLFDVSTHALFGRLLELLLHGNEAVRFTASSAIASLLLAAPSIACIE